MRSIVLYNNISTQNWKFCFNHHGINYTKIDYWEKPDDLHFVRNSDIILDYDILKNLYQYQRTHLENLLSNNRMFLVAICDSPVIFRDSIVWLEQLDNFPDSSQITCVLECEKFDHDLQNINVDFDPESMFFDITEQRVSTRLAKSYIKDFLICMGRKDLSRDVLWEKLQNQPWCDNSIMIYHGYSYYDLEWQGYQGEHSAPLAWQRPVVPSLDFYRQCCFELVAETFTSTSIWFTEKTIKPLAAKTPFVLLATPHSLKTLRNLGFKTFDKLIDESYDNETNFDARIKAVVDVSRHIVDNGAKNFAESCQEITDHNWNRLAEIKGHFVMKKDRRYFDLLDLYQGAIRSQDT